MQNQFNEILSNLKRFCAYRERSHKEVEQKLKKICMHEDWREEIFCILIEDDYLNEMRFASLYVSGKFRIKKWGRLKIINELKSKGISSYCIEKAINQEISNDDYKTTIEELLLKKAKTLSIENLFITKQKLIKFAMGKGYEFNIVSTIINEIDFNLAYQK